jgi:hypothetical protein
VHFESFLLRSVKQIVVPLFLRYLSFSSEKLVELGADDVSEARSENSPRERKGARKLCLNQSADALSNHRECPAATNLS